MSILALLIVSARARKTANTKFCTQAYVIVLYFPLLHFIVFLQAESIWQPYMEPICQCHFSKGYSSLHISVHPEMYFGNSHNISNFFIIIVLVMIICDQSSDVTILIVLECHVLSPYKTVNLINKYVWSDYFTNQPTLLSFSLSLGFYIPWDITKVTLGQLITLQWPLRVQVKGRVTHLALYQKLKMIKHSEEGKLKAETGWKLSLLH